MLIYREIEKVNKLKNDVVFMNKNNFLSFLVFWIWYGLFFVLEWNEDLRFCYIFNFVIRYFIEIMKF